LDARADRDRLHQLVVNLLDNAAGHSPPGGRITVTAAVHAEALSLEVQDEGPGIPAGERVRVFERFSRGSIKAHSPYSAQNGTPDGGTGLGLAIARWVVDLHGGTIAVVDGPGCHIRVTLPTR
jgi:signal transduction histidine kinase